MNDAVMAVMQRRAIAPGGSFAVTPDQLGMTLEQFHAFALQLMQHGGGEGYSVDGERQHHEIWTPAGKRYDVVWLRRDQD